MNRIRTHHPKVEWSTLVWFMGSLPKHNFICWLIMLDRLGTRSRLNRKVATIPIDCLFCGKKRLGVIYSLNVHFLFKFGIIYISIV